MQRYLFIFSLAALVSSRLGADSQSITASLDGWTVSGGVNMDEERAGPGGEPSMRLDPGSRAVYSLRDQDASGTVEIEFYDDGTVPEKPKARRAGPHVGVITESGRVLALGPIYAPYLSANHLTVTEVPAGNQTPWSSVQYVGQARKEGWQKVSYEFDPEAGVTIKWNGKALSRFDWNKTQIGGFAGVVLVGDMGEAPGQTLWVGNVSATLGGEMVAKPEPPPPPPPVVPAEDPEPEGLLVNMDAERMQNHPRLLFTVDELDEVRAKLETPIGKLMLEQLEAYIKPSTPPETPAFAKNDTDGQRHGLWRLPTLALHARLTGDPDSLRHATTYLRQMEAADVWQGGKERNSGMGAANVLAGAALAYDWLYHDLEPEFREAMRQKLILQARRMYYGGHLNRNNAMGYWQGDPQNNHRWHRNAGLTLAALAAYEGSESETWLVETAFKDLQYVMKWRPEDGSYSEGPGYMFFGGVHLLLALAASDDNLGTEFQQHPFILNNGNFMVQTLVPDRRGVFPFNDTGGGAGFNGYAVYLHRVAALSRDSVLQFMINDAWRNQANRFTHIAWLGMLWMDPSLPEAELSEFPTRSIFHDTGVAFIRDGWTEDSAALMFRSMPIGGRKLNEYRNANDFKYVNVAHDDPDANSFVLWKNGKLLAETNRYSNQKQSASHNTILINGMGQAPAGRRPDPMQWMQPATGKSDMLDMAFFTGWEPGEQVVVVEGEAAGSYTANRNKRGDRRPSLSRYRRTVIWVESRYVLVLDDIRAENEEVDLTWLMQGPELEIIDADSKQFMLRHDAAECPFQVVSLSEMDIDVVDSPADSRGTALGWRQLRLQGRGRTFKLASVYDLWGGGDVRVRLEASDDGTATVRVTTGETTDQWAWVPAMETDALSVRKEVPE